MRTLKIDHNLTISIDPRLMTFLEASQNAGVQKQIDQATASLKKTGDEVEKNLKENK